MSFYSMPVADRHYPINRLKPKPAKILTTFNAGELVPLWVKECVPGDRRTVVPAFSLRSQTPLHPVFDDAYLDIFVFFCPARHQFDQFVNEWGELDGDHYWVDTTDYLEPAVVAGSNGFLPIPSRTISACLSASPASRRTRSRSAPTSISGTRILEINRQCPQLRARPTIRTSFPRRRSVRIIPG